MEKVKVYTVQQEGGGTLYSTTLEDLLETLKYELQNIEDDDEPMQFNFSTIYMTQKEIDSAGEFDGF